MHFVSVSIAFAYILWCLSLFHVLEENSPAQCGVVESPKRKKSKKKKIFKFLKHF